MKKERRSLKEVVKANKSKILMGGMFIVGFASCYILECKFNMKKNDERISTLYEAASEGMIQEAIATTVRKLNKREILRDRLVEHLKNFEDEDTQNKLTKVMEEISILSRRYEKFEEARKAYEIFDE